MISPAEATNKILQQIPKPRQKRTPLLEAFGLVLAEDLEAPFDLPLADNSAMDGYVFSKKDLLKKKKQKLQFKMSGILKAGDAPVQSIPEGGCFRILTGAFIPKNGAAVVAQEEVLLRENWVELTRLPSLGQHIRKKGEEIRKGEVLLKKGTLLNPAAIGLLASFGWDKICVYPKPNIAILATGSELVSPGKKIRAGQIYDSNSWMIQAALEQMHLKAKIVKSLPDDLFVVQEAIHESLKLCDFILLLGGVSVGDYDVVKEALEKEGVKTVFWKVAQKPGKPFYFGYKKEKMVFGLPGNPAAVFTCFYEYVYSALCQSLGFQSPGLVSQSVQSSQYLRADSSRHLFLKAKSLHSKSKKNMQVEILEHQASHMLSSLVQADGFISVPPSKGKEKKLKSVEMHFLPYLKF